jgi:hypothetical protein
MGLLLLTVVIGAVTIIGASFGVVRAMSARPDPATVSARPRAKQWQLDGRRVELARPRVRGRPARLWYARFPDHALAQRTTLHISEHDDVTRRMATMGARGVLLGEASFDDRFHIEGGEPDAVRGVLSVSDVRTALLDFFHLRGAQLVTLTPNGVLEVQLQRAIDFDEEAAIRRASRLSRVLEDARETPGVGAPHAQSPTGGTGSESGLPIGVPLTRGD